MRGNKMRPIQLLAWVLAASLLLSGCQGRTAAQTSLPSGNVVVDCAGRTVTLPDQTETIACLYAYTGHVAALLGCEGKITAVVDGLKRDQLMQRKVPGIRELPAPYASGSINIEELAQAAPDLIFLRASNLQDAGETEKLDRLGIPYLVVEYTTMEQQRNSIRVMGKALGCEEKAEAYLAYYQETIDFVRQRTSAIPESERKRVYHSVNEAVRTDIPDTLSYEVLDAAGCINVVTSEQQLRLDGEKGYVTVEQIYVWDPDVILANEPSAAEYFRTDDKFSGLRSVLENRVYQLPVGISRWAHPGSLESPLAALYIAKLLYPGYLEDVDMEQEIRDFYQSFLDIALTEAEIGQILAGNGMRSAREGGN